MVYSSSRVGTRTLIKAAVLCALSLSALPSARAENSLDASTATDVDVCGISDGDKSVGIRVIDDSSCASGGLGCYNDHCRFCKILETPQSSAFENCTTFGVDFPTMAPLVVSTGTCEVSSGDAAVGISAVTDTACLYGGLGCFNDHCRFCKLETTAQSEAFVNCSDYNVTAGSATDVPVDAATDAPVTTVTTDGCTLVPAEGDVEVGISIGTDPTCSAGGLGCINDVCRFCRVRTTAKSATYYDCALLGTSAAGSGTAGSTDAPTPTETPAATPAVTPAVDGDTPTPVLVEDPAATSAAPAETPAATAESPTATTEAPAGSTDVPAATTAAPVITADSPAATTAAPVAATTCTITPSVGDSAVGISIVTDATCVSGGIGCITDVCRFCKVTTSLQSAAFLDCAQFSTDSSASDVPVVDKTDLSDDGDFSTDDSDVTDASDADVETPAATTDLPVETPAATTDVSAETPAATTETPSVTPATPDATTEAPVTSTDAPAAETEAPAAETEAPAATTATPVQGGCTQTVSEGDAAVGIQIVSDATCSAGGVGCIDSVCRFCKVRTTDQSAAFVDCASISGTTATTDAPTEAPTDAPTDAPTEAPTDAPTDAPTEAPTEAPTGETCAQTVSEGDAAVGIKIVTDTSCANGGVGCIDNVCRFCKLTTTDQSAAFVDCSSIESVASVESLTEDVHAVDEKTTQSIATEKQPAHVEFLSKTQGYAMIAGCIAAVAAVAVVARAAKRSSTSAANPNEPADDDEADDDEAEDAESGQRVSPGPVPTEEPVTAEA